MDIEKLLLSKFLMKKGESFIESNDPMSNGLAISLFQDAAELVLWTIASTIEADIGEKDSFVKLWEQINKKHQKEPLPLKEKMFELNRTRVSFKHYGVLPEPSLAFKYHGYVSEFINNSITKFLGIDYQKVSLADLVHDGEVRKYLKEAEEHLDQGENKEALISCEIANQNIQRSLERVIPKISYGMERFGERLKAADERDDLRMEWSEIVNFIDDLRTMLVVSILGLKMQDFLRYKKNAPGVFMARSGKVSATFHGKDCSARDVQFCIGFIINTAIQAQNHISAV